MKDKASDGVSLIFFLTTFYSEELYRLVHSYDRGKLFAMLLIALKNIGVFVFSISKELSNISNRDIHFKFLVEDGYAGFLDESWLQDTVLNMSLVINAMLVAYLLGSVIRYCWYERNRRSKKEWDEVMQQENQDYSQADGMKIIGQNVFGAILSVYTHIVFIPCFFFSLNQISRIQSLLNLFLSLILNTILADCDFDYTLSSRDYLARPFVYFQSLFTTVIEVLFYLAMQQIGESSSLIAAIYYLLNIILTLFISPYYQSSSQFAKVFASLFFGIVSLSLCAIITWEKKPELFSLFILLSLPFSYQLTKLLINKGNLRFKHTLLQLSKGDDTEDVSLMALDFLIRQNIFGQIESQKQDDARQMRFLAAIRLFRTYSISKGKSNSNRQDNLREFDDISDVNEDLRLLLRDQLRKQIRNKKRKRSSNTQGIGEQMVYFIFLLELISSPRLYWVKRSELSLNPNRLLTLKQKQLFHSIHEIFIKTRAVLIQQQGKNNTFDYSFLQVISFEERLQKSYVQLDEAVKAKILILGQMKQRTMFVETLIDSIERFQGLSKSLRRNLNSLSEINHDNADLLNLQALYLENIAFSEKDISIFSKAQQKRKEMMMGTKKKTKIYKIKSPKKNSLVDKINLEKRKPQKSLANIDPMNSTSSSKSSATSSSSTSSYVSDYSDASTISSTYASRYEKFDEDCCVIFAKYLDGLDFTIQKTSLNFASVFSNEITNNNEFYKSTQDYFTSKSQDLSANGMDITNKSIDTLMPQFMKSQHPNYVDTFINQKVTSNDGKCKMTTQIIFASVSSQHIIPVKIDVRLNQIDLLSTFGVTAKIKRINKLKDYAIFDKNTLQVIGITHRLHNYLFPHHDSAHKQGLHKLFPFLTKNTTSNVDIMQKNEEQQIISPKTILPESQFSVKKQRKPFIVIIRLDNYHKNNATNNNNNKLNLLSSMNSVSKDLTTTQAPGSYKLSKSSKKRHEFVFNLGNSVNTNTNNPIQKPNSSLLFIYTEVREKSIKYKNIHKLKYLEIIKLRNISPIDSPALILQHIKHPDVLSLYHKVFTYAEMNSILSELEARSLLLSQYHTHSLLNNNNSIINSRHPANSAKSFHNNMMNYLSPNQDHRENTINEADEENASIQVNDGNTVNSNILEGGGYSFHSGGEDYKFNKKINKTNNPNSNNKNNEMIIPIAAGQGNSMNQNEISKQELITKEEDIDYSTNQIYNNYNNNISLNYDQVNYGNTNSMNNFNDSAAQINNQMNSSVYNQNTSINQNYMNYKFNSITNNYSNNLIQKQPISVEDVERISAVLNPSTVFIENGTTQLPAPRQELGEFTKINSKSYAENASLGFIQPSAGNLLTSAFNNVDSFVKGGNVNKQSLISPSAASVSSAENNKAKFFSPRISGNLEANTVGIINSPISGYINSPLESQKAVILPLFPVSPGGQLNSPQPILSPGNMAAQFGVQNQYFKANAFLQSNTQYVDHQLLGHGSSAEQLQQQQWQISQDNSFKSHLNVIDKVKQKEEKKRKLEEIQQEISSTNSKESSSASAKRQLCTIMADKSVLSAIKVIDLLGVACFFAMVAVTLVQFFSMKSNIDGMHQDYNVFEWPTKYQSTLSCILKDQNALYMTADSFVSFTSTTVKKAFRSGKTGDMMNYRDLVSTLISEMEGIDSNRKIFQLLRTNYFVFQIGQQYNLTVISGTNSVPSALVAVPWNSTIEIGIILAFQHVYRYSVGAGKGRPEYYMIQNQLAQISSLKSVQEQILTLQLDEEASIQNNLTELMVVTMVIAAFCIGIIIPLFSYIQNQRDIIMQLFATFSTQKIDLLLKNITNSYSQLNSSVAYSAQRNVIQIKQQIIALLNTEKDKDARKQNISFISQLPRFNARLIALAIVVYGLMVCYPIIIKIVSQEYLNQSSLDLKTMIKVYQLRSYMLENIAMNYNILAMKLYPTLKPQKPSIYYDYLNNLQIQSSDFLESIDWLVQEQYSSSRYSQDLYDEFFFPAIKSDLCKVFTQYPEYNSNSTRLNTATCATLSTGFLTHGIQVAYKKYLAMFPDLYLIYTNTDTTAAALQLTKFLSTFDIVDFTAFQESLEEAIVSLQQFILIINTNYYDYITVFQTVLVVYQMMVMTFVFLLGWIYFSRYLNSQLHHTKNYLQVIDINTLIDNSYILTYIKKNSSL